MSWKGPDPLGPGPSTLSDNQRNGEGSGAGSSSKRLMDRLRPNGSGLTAYQRERQVVARYGDAYGVGSGEGAGRRTEWDVLKENHRFIRDDEDSGEVSWEERLARVYESKLFKEFALIDLKHYKSKRLALRWRTAPEVVEGIGEDTCGSLRCRHHRPTPPEEDESTDEERYRRDDRDRDGRRSKKRRKEKPPPSLRAFELPFVYEEAGQRKEALVKVKLCGRCERKLKWKPPPAGEREEDSEQEDEEENGGRRRARRDDDEERRGSARSRSPRRRRRSETDESPARAHSRHR